ncbi:ribosomal protein S27AE [Sphingomonas sp. F9_3S_D5_B_2]
MIERSEGVPRHREAYPRFNVVQAKAALERFDGDTVCVFSQSGRTIGHLIVSDVDIETNVLQIASFVTSPHLNGTTALETLSMKMAPSGVDAGRRSVICPQCSRSTFNLYYNNKWKCAICHKLAYRSQLITKDTQLMERRDALKAMVGRGRPMHMRNTVFQQLRIELRHANLRLGRRFHQANEVHSIIATDEWVRAGDVSDLWIRGYAVSAGRVVQTSFAW